MDIKELIDREAENIVKAMGMPVTKTTTVEKELSKSKKRKVFETRVFLIINDASAATYSSFITQLIAGDDGRRILRESENWTKDGELIRVVDTVREVDA